LYLFFNSSILPAHQIKYFPNSKFKFLILRLLFVLLRIILHFYQRKFIEFSFKHQNRKMSSIKKIYKSAKHTVMQIPEIERKVLEATSHEDKWGPTGTQMREIAQATYNTYHDLPIIMAAIFRRLNDDGKYWRHVYKSLLLLEYIIKNGSEEAIREARDHIIEIQTLSEFQHIDENNKDVGVNVRERSKIIVELLHDEQRLKSEREKARKNAKKFIQGMGSDTHGFGGYSGSYDYDRDRDRERENETTRNEEDEEPEEPKETKKTSSSVGRPRAASGDNSSSVSVPQKPVLQNQPSLLDIDNVPHQGSSQTNLAHAEKDFFSTPANQLFGSTQSTGFGFGSQPTSNLFDPRGTSNNAFGTNNNAFGSSNNAFGTNNNAFGTNNNAFGSTKADEWNDFQGSSVAQSSQQNQEDKSKDDKLDPWTQTHLFGSLSKESVGSSSNSNLSSLPMGQMSVPMGQLPKSNPSSTAPKVTPNYDALTPRRGPMGMGYGVPPGRGYPPTQPPMGMGMGYGIPPQSTGFSQPQPNRGQQQGNFGFF